MSRTLLWKEWREHLPVLIALALLSAFTLGAVWYWVEPVRAVPPGSNKAAMLLLAAVLLAGVHGIISGALPLAGEHESGTLPFLDVLTARRLVLWRAKLAGVTVLVLGHALWLKLWLYCFGQPASGSWWQQDGGSLVVLAMVELLALAWGLFASALCATVLTASALGAFLLIITVLPAQTLVSGMVADPADSAALIGLLLMEALLALPALAGSYWVFCRSDWSRVPELAAVGNETVTVPSPAGLRQLWWLNWSQARPHLPAFLVGTLFVTMFLSWSSLALWPVLTALLGLFCGTFAFAVDRQGDSQRFLGEQRLPLGRVWAVKVAFWLGLAVLLALVPLAFELSLVVRAAIRPNPPPMTGSIGIDATLFRSLGWFTFLFFWMLYAFSIAQFVALIVRKGGVALFLSGFAAGGLILLWLPSLVMGGVGTVTLFAGPLWLLLVTRLAFWPWSTGQLASRRWIVGLVAGVLVLAGWCGAGLAYRVHELPDIGEPFDRKAYAAELAQAEQQESGRLLRQAAHELDERLRDVPGHNEWGQRSLDKQWFEADPEHGESIDRIFRGTWFEHLQHGVTLPPDLIHDPRRGRLFDATDQTFIAALRLLRLRTTQLQEQKDLRGALDILVLRLDLIRHLQQHASFSVYFSYGSYQQETLKLLEEWRSAAAARPELLKHALVRMAEYEKQLPPLVDCIKATYLTFLNTFDQPASWNQGQHDAFQRRMVADVLQQAPWERERLLRIVNIYFAGWIRSAEVNYWETELRPDDWMNLWVDPTHAAGVSSAQMSRLLRECRPAVSLVPFLSGLRLHEMTTLRHLRILQLRLAIDLYRNEHMGALPAGVRDLVPQYLPAIPIDPKSGMEMSLPE